MTLAASKLEFALLGLLREKPKSGYDLRKLFAATPVRHFSDSPGSIYPALRRLEARGWVAAAPAAADGRQRRAFRVTVSGRSALLGWLRQPVTREDVIWRLEDLTLRFAFFDGNVERAVTLRFLADFERELEAYVAELQAYAVSSGLRNFVSTGALAFSLGIDGYRGQLSWARRARQQLSEAKS